MLKLRIILCLQCFDAVGWAAEDARGSGGYGERGAYVHEVDTFVGEGV